MSFLLRHIARYAAQKKPASDPRAREKAAKVARVVVDEARHIARREDKARAAGRVLRRALNKLQVGGLTGQHDQSVNQKADYAERRDPFGKSYPIRGTHIPSQ